MEEKQSADGWVGWIGVCTRTKMTSSPLLVYQNHPFPPPSILCPSAGKRGQPGTTTPPPKLNLDAGTDTHAHTHGGFKAL